MKFGEDVFTRGYISKEKENKFIKFLHSLRLLMEVHDVEHYRICATSAMRGAANAVDIIQRAYRELACRLK